MLLVRMATMPLPCPACFAPVETLGKHPVCITGYVDLRIVAMAPASPSIS